MVYAYEDGALRTFRRARQLGVTCVWDLPTGHYPVVEEVWRNEARRWPTSVEAAVPLEPPWKKRRKDLEFALADIVSVASGFVRDSVQRQDPRKHVMVTPYGFPVEEFQARQTPPPGPFTVLSVGVHSVRKGSHYLLEAWRRAGIRDARLRIIGPLRLSTSFLSGYTGLFEHVPYVPRAHLGAEYRAADLLAFPTLCDGFGLVIQESMCCGTPVIATPCSGGPECITDGEDGWVVPARDMEALVDRFRTAAADRDRLFRMGQRARKRAERWTWLEAGAKLIESLGGKGP
jgi:glycosyltransferase involved in cell wall biosynthesis